MSAQGQFTRNGLYGVPSAQIMTETYAPANFIPAGSGHSTVQTQSNYQQQSQQQPQQQMPHQRAAQQSNPQLVHQDQRRDDQKVPPSCEEVNISTTDRCEALYRGFLDGQKLNQESSRDMMNAAINLMHVATNLMKLQIKKHEVSRLQLCGQLLDQQNMQYSAGEGSNFSDQPMDQPIDQPMNQPVNQPVNQGRL